MSAEEALRALRTSLHPPDFILADQWMPGMPVEGLLTSGTKGDIPDEPFDAIVMEPFSIEHLAATLRCAGRRTRAHARVQRLTSEGPLPASLAKV